jgi:Kef-type K+ transport system membrane component KefB
VTGKRGKREGLRSGRRRRAFVTAELVIVFPLLFGIVLAAVEFGLLLTASERVQLACATACRVGTRPCDDLGRLDRDVRLAAQVALVSDQLAGASRIAFIPGGYTGDPVIVEIRVPMSAASPDLLGAFGFSLKHRFLISRVVMRKE